VRLHHVTISCACSICNYIVQTNRHLVSLHATPPCAFNCMRGLTQMDPGFFVFHVTCSRPTVQVIRKHHLVCALFRFSKPTRSTLARPYTQLIPHAFSAETLSMIPRTNKYTQRRDSYHVKVLSSSWANMSSMAVYFHLELPLGTASSCVVNQQAL